MARRRRHADTPRPQRLDKFDVHPASPTKLGIGHLFIRNVNGYLITATYTQLWPFKAVIEKLTSLHGQYKWKNPHTLTFPNGISVSTDCTEPYHVDDRHVPAFIKDKWAHTRSKPQHYENIIERCIDVDLTSDQELWDIPDPLGSVLVRLPDLYPSLSDPDRPRRQRQASGDNTLGDNKPQRDNTPRPPRPDKTGLTHVGALLPDIAPGKIRDALRRSGEPKPAAGWLFAETDHARIIKLVKENLR